MDGYSDFLQHKLAIAPKRGLDVSNLTQSSYLKHHQFLAVKWAAGLGTALIAARFGLGKTRMQLELLRIAHQQTGQKVLIVCPLGVKYQFVDEDAPIMGMRVQYVKSDAEVAQSDTPYLITNFERVREGNIDPRLHNFGAVSIDEGQALRDLGSDTYQTFTDVFAQVPFRFVNSATPAPNNYIELLNYAEFLGVMDRGQALTRWFKRDSTHAGHLTLMSHKESEFWMWVASWALFLFKPSDVGGDDTGYDLPKLNIVWHRITTDQTRAHKQIDSRGQRRLLLDASGGVSQAATESRETMQDRIAKAKELIEQSEPNRHWILWHHLEAERHAIQKAIPEVTSVYGAQDLELREKNVLAFSRGKLRILSTKPELSGAGCNFQHHCYSNIFVGVRYQFEEYIQALHRTYRFLQPHEVDVHIIYAESQDAIVETWKKKWTQYDTLVEKMREITMKYGLSHEEMKKDLQRAIGLQRREVNGEFYTLVNNDSTIEMQSVQSDSIDLIHTSVPFGNHYEYTTNVEDFGYNPSDGDFWSQMDYLIPSLYRILKPGRVAAIHVKDRILYGHQTQSGFMEVSEFSDDCVKAFKKHGFMYEGRRTIVTDVVRENASTYRLGWSEMTNDATKMGCGLPEYLLLFRKPPTLKDNARADEPVTKSKQEYTRARWQLDAHSLWRSNGKTYTPQELADLAPDMVRRIFEQEQLNHPYDYERHVEIVEAMDAAGHLSASFMMVPPKVTVNDASPVWDDIVYMRTLNSEQSRGREQNHICPLPFDIVERVIRLYSNEGDLVLDPFGGLGTVPFLAVKMKRRAFSCELNPVYFDASVRYLAQAEIERKTPTLLEWALQAGATEQIEDEILEQQAEMLED